MNLETLRNNSAKILDCPVKDSDGLNDFQKLPDEYAIEIDQVGIERFRIPLRYKHKDGEVLSHDTEAAMSIFLKKAKTGVNMSRFCKILQDEAEDNPVGKEFFHTVIKRFRSDLRDYEDEDLIEKAFLNLKFNYPLKQKSLKSDNWGWQYYNCELAVQSTLTKDLLIDLTLQFEYSSTCPCSLSMSKQYEAEYAKGKTTEGNGIATAHGQRSTATCRVQFCASDYIEIEEIIELIRVAIPTETQSLVKRIDEQAFAILNGENPMFVEHVARRLAVVFDNVSKIKDWEAKIEHFESLHSHNAVARIKKSAGKIGTLS